MRHNWEGNFVLKHRLLFPVYPSSGFLSFPSSLSAFPFWFCLRHKLFFPSFCPFSASLFSISFFLRCLLFCLFSPSSPFSLCLWLLCSLRLRLVLPSPLIFSCLLFLAVAPLSLFLFTFPLFCLLFFFFFIPPPPLFSILAAEKRSYFILWYFQLLNKVLHMAEDKHQWELNFTWRSHRFEFNNFSILNVTA